MVGWIILIDHKLIDSLWTTCVFYLPWNTCAPTLNSKWVWALVFFCKVFRSSLNLSFSKTLEVLSLALFKNDS